jgi:hypothetical protein
MSELMIRIHNSETGEIIDREMTPDEITEAMARKAEAEAEEAALLTKETEKAALLTKLGITDDEAKLLLS